MELDSLYKKIESFGITTKEGYFAEAFSRNIGLLTKQEQEKLARSKVAIPGMGGVGGVHLITMVRSGVGNFHIADFDTYEPANINRQFGARVPDFGRPKIEVMAEQALSINPYINITMFKQGISESNLDEFLDGVDVVIDGLDFFCFEIRRLLFKRAVEKGLHVITAGPMGFSGAMLIFSPGGMGFDEYFNIRPGMPDQEKYLSFALGLSPKATHVKYMDLKKVSLDSKAGPSLNASCQICSGMAAAEALKVMLGKGKVKPAPHYFQYDPYLQVLKKGYLFMGNKNPVQKIKMKVVKFLLQRNKPGLREDAPERPSPAPEKDEDISDPVLEYLIRAGVQAPSGDNCQPSKFTKDKNRIDLYLDQDCDRSFFNFRQIASIIACGAGLENIKVAASSFGITARVDDEPGKPDSDLLASVRLIPDQAKKDLLSDFIWQRHTNRKFYKAKPIDDSVRQSIESSIKAIPGARLDFITQKDRLKALAKIIYRIDRIRTEYRPLHEHLMKMIRFTDQEALKTRDGFPLKNLEAGPAGEVFLKMTRPWAVMNVANTLGLGRMVALHSYQGIVRSSGAALLTVNGVDQKDFLAGGRALSRAWLTITSLDMAFQPMTAITLFYLRWILEGKGGFLKKHQKVLEEVETEYNRLFPVLRDKNRGQIMLFRFGFADDMKVRTLRR